MATPAGLALDGGDPRLSSGLAVADYTPAMRRLLHDPSVMFEEYLYYAKESRAWEDSPANASRGGERGIMSLFKKSSGKDQGEVKFGITPTEEEHQRSAATEKSSLSKDPPDVVNNGDTKSATGVVVTGDEWVTAARAARTATWGAVFYLLTTDIIGPFTVP